MYSIFKPLDHTERVPREVIIEMRRRRMWQMADIDLGSALFLPALLVAFVLLGSFGLPALLAFGLAVLTVTGSYAAIATVRRLSASRT